MKLLLISLLAASALMFDVSCEEKFRFDNYKLVRLFPTTPDHVRFVQQLEDLNVDVWAELLVGEKKSVDIMLSPEEFGQFTNVFRRKKLNFEVVNDNIQNLIDLEAESMKQSAKNSRSIIFRYARYSEVLNYIDEMVEKNSDIASSQIIGTTHEGRVLKIIKLRKGNPTKSVWIDCGIHAREWVSPSSCVFIIHQLIDELRNSDSVVSALFDKYDFHILPLHNPDGYEFTHQVYRLWRKNRRPNAGSTCFGIDLNRNFPSYWLTGGSTLDPCSDIHAGPYVASEKETQAVMKYIKDRKGQWDSFLNIHSYGNWWLTSYGHTPDEVPPDHQLMMDAAIVGCEAIKSYNGSVFIPGPSSQLLYVVTGGSADWAYLEMGVRYSYVLELRPGQGTPDYVYGFTLPEDRMPLVATETYLGIKAFLNYISKL